jgi:flagellar protein FliJ
VETPSFTFRLERVRSLRERAEEAAREELARELQLRLRGEALLRAATDQVSTARDAGLGVIRSGASGADLIAAQAYMERAERDRREAAIDLDRQDAEVELRRKALTSAAQERESIDRLKARRRAEHDREVARREQIDLDEIAIGVHRRGKVAA